MDFLSEHNKQTQINEGLFDRILKKNPVQQATEPEEVTPEEPKKVVKKNPPQFKSNKIYSFNMNKVPVLNLQDLGKIYLSFKSPDDFSMFQRILQFIKRGFLENDLNTLQKAIKYGEVDGYGPYQYLSSIFSSPGNNISKILPGQPYRYGRKISEAAGDINFTMPKNSTLRNPSTEIPERYTTLESMKRLEMFIKYFVENIVDEKGAPNIAVRNLITNKLKEILGTNKVQNTNPQTKPSSKVQTEPGTQKQDIVGGEETGEENITNSPEEKAQSALSMLQKQAQGKNKKNIQKEIRDLLRDNF